MQTDQANFILIHIGIKVQCNILTLPLSCFVPFPSWFLSQSITSLQISHSFASAHLSRLCRPRLKPPTPTDHLISKRLTTHSNKQLKQCALLRNECLNRWKASESAADHDTECIPAELWRICAACRHFTFDTRKNRYKSINLCKF